jgi:hypothetical protein
MHCAPLVFSLLAQSLEAQGSSRRQLLLPPQREISMVVVLPSSRMGEPDRGRSASMLRSRARTALPSTQPRQALTASAFAGTATFTVSTELRPMALESMAKPWVNSVSMEILVHQKPIPRAFMADP